MRLWHKDLIDVLPRKQLISQWRECVAIAGAINKNGTPNHLLVNYVLDYPLEMFIEYSRLIKQEMENRKYKTSNSSWDKIKSVNKFVNINNYKIEDIYKEIHNKDYYNICCYNLYEKYLRGGISNEEWDRIKKEENKIK